MADWWVGASCSRPALSVLVVGGEGYLTDAVLKLTNALGHEGCNGAAGITSRRLTIHSAARFQDLEQRASAIGGPISIDVVVIVVGRGITAAETARRELLQLPIDLRFGRTILVVVRQNGDGLPESWVEEIRQTTKVPVLFAQLNTEEQIYLFARRLWFTFRTTLGLNSGIPRPYFFF